jgi:hypothetical protein
MNTQHGQHSIDIHAARKCSMEIHEQAAWICMDMQHAHEWICYKQYFMQQGHAPGIWHDYYSAALINT